MNKYFYYRAGFFIPAIISFFVSYYSIGYFMEADFIENLLISTVALLFCALINHRKVKLWLEIILLFGIYLFTYIETFHYSVFKAKITSSTIFIFFETNKSEFGSFVTLYFNTFNIVLIILFLIFFIISFYLLIRYNIKNNFSFYKQKIKLPFVKIYVKVGFVWIFIFLFFFSYEKRILPNYLPYTVAKAYVQYSKEMDKYNKIAFKKTGGNFTNVKHSEVVEDEIYLIIIGEATTRQHMGLYEYPRKTNPLLSNRKDLVVYQNVISPHTHTITSLGKVLTLANYENPEKKFSGSILQLFNKADFKTYWVSNQKPSGMWETFVTALSKSADEHYFINISHNNSKTPYDGELLIPLKKILSDKQRRKLIVVHLMGSHATYNKRYPTKFEKFTGKPPNKNNNILSEKLINEYDNTVLYNDYVVNEIINEIKKQKAVSSVIYFSDHGEDVFDVNDFSGHSEKNGTSPMYEIPFFIWFSEKYINDELVFKINRKYMTDDFIYTLADIAKINFNEYDKTRSIVNPAFQTRKRIIKNQNSYDEIFKKK